MNNFEDQSDTATVSSSGPVKYLFALGETWLSKSGTRYRVSGFTSAGKAILRREPIRGKSRAIILTEPPADWREA